MASAPEGFEPRDPRPAEPQAAETRAAGPPAEELTARPPRQNLLDQILTETALGELSDGQYSGEDAKLLREVAARYPTEAFDLEPVAVELVRAVVGEPFRELIGGHEQWCSMTYEIAQTLFDDPRSRQRLQSLWNRLREAAP